MHLCVCVFVCVCVCVCVYVCVHVYVCVCVYVCVIEHFQYENGVFRGLVLLDIDHPNCV